MAKDPVCGMEVNEGASAATAEHHGQTYYFCSRDCKEAFEKNPDSYVPK